MEFDVALQYPDGRIYETVLYGVRAMKPDMEFENVTARPGGFTVGSSPGRLRELLILTQRAGIGRTPATRAGRRRGRKGAFAVVGLSE